MVIKAIDVQCAKKNVTFKNKIKNVDGKTEQKISGACSTKHLSQILPTSRPEIRITTTTTTNNNKKVLQYFDALGIRRARVVLTRNCFKMPSTELCSHILSIL